jgi:opacity protein-like surface antigen
VLTLLASTAGAQQKGRVAVDMGIPAAFAVLWHTGDRVAVRPEFGFVRVSVDNNSTTRFDLGASGLLSLEPSGSLTPYIGLRVAYSWLTESDAPTQWSFAGIFGARYALDKRFGVSAETGLSFARTHSDAAPIINEKVFQPWGRVSALVYF